MAAQTAVACAALHCSGLARAVGIDFGGGGDSGRRSGPRTAPAGGRDKGSRRGHNGEPMIWPWASAGAMCVTAATAAITAL